MKEKERQRRVRNY